MAQPFAPCAWLRGALIATTAMLASAALAVDTPPSDALPDLAPIRTLIYSGEYAKAVAELEPLAQKVRHADVFNLLAFSLRNVGRYDEADRWYREALYYNPEHLQAIEYQGELFITTGRLDKAQENIVTLKIFCPKGCAELEKLETAYAKAAATK
ncbi:tetratricopeptide repeat protein [Ancylobacter terrae]|uniref:tetratricopeptide repeat protein n=1 Tax=Ancylobacter sp. sgz301288 TaxID=3342077 RepID=UPI00385C272D